MSDPPQWLFGRFNQDDHENILRMKKLDLAERPKDRFNDLFPVRHKNLGPSADVLPCGLINPGNLSFLNATLQSLLACSPFVQFLQELWKCDVSMVEFPCLAAFYKLANEVSVPTRKENDFLGTGSPFYPSMFHEVLKIFTPHVSPPGARPREEDAQTFLRFVMVQMQKELENLEGKSSHNGVESSLKSETARTLVSLKLSSVFGGELCSAATPNANVSPFTWLLLDISQNRVVGLEDALHQFCERDEPVKYIGKANWTSPKDVRIKKPPEIMILLLNRFCPGSAKVIKPVKIPLKLELDQSVLSSTPGIRSGKQTKENYKLISTISHHGKEVSDGHYTAHALYGNGWLRFDDASVTVIDTSKVPLENAYILFYKKM